MAFSVKGAAGVAGGITKQFADDKGKAAGQSGDDKPIKIAESAGKRKAKQDPGKS